MALRRRGGVDRDPGVGSRWSPLSSDVGSRWTPPLVWLPCGFAEAKQHCVMQSTMAKAASRGSRSYMASLLSGILVAWLSSTTVATIQGQKTQGFYTISITQAAVHCASRVQANVQGSCVNDSVAGWAPSSPVHTSSNISRPPPSCRDGCGGTMPFVALTTQCKLRIQIDSASAAPLALAVLANACSSICVCIHGRWTRGRHRAR